MKGIQGFRLRGATKKAATRLSTADAGSASSSANDEALARLTLKTQQMAPQFHSISEGDFGDWVDALPFDEFIEMIGLGNEGVGAIIKETCSQTTKKDGCRRRRQKANS